nr:SRPBCC family protein [uncultured Actinoplanes sp.]
MPTIRLHQNTTATPEQLVAGITDFGPGRQELFGNSADDRLRVHSRSPGHADVTEGSGGFWERLEYDWTDPRRITMRTVDSNIWGGASGHTYTITPKPDGTTDLDVVVVREGKNLKGKLIGALLASVGKGVLSKTLAGTVRAIESRGAGGRPA